MTEEQQETATLSSHQWNVVMDILRLDTQSDDAKTRLGDVARQADEILQSLIKQLGRDGIERH
jgi:predicted transcriptional regulator